MPGRAWEFGKQLARGRVLSMQAASFPEALSALQKARRNCEYCVDPLLASVFDRAGLPDSALHYYERWAAVGEDTWQNGIYSLDPPLAWFRMAELYEAKGDRAKALDFYGRFTELWREADAQLQPKVRTAKQRMAELVKAEPR
jgi:tetratricopeptide (TPR) repeat protein